MVSSTLKMYHTCNRLLERRIKELSDRKEITLTPELKRRFEPKKEEDSLEDVTYKNMVIFDLCDTEEVVNSSNDIIVKRLYSLCEKYKRELHLEHVNQ